MKETTKQTPPAVTETTPLVPKNTDSRESQKTWKYSLSPLNRVLLCGFLVSLSFSVTQVPLLYVFRVMTCDSYYETHEWLGPPGKDRCMIPPVEGGTARAIALLSGSTTFFGIMNLLLTGWLIKRVGVKYALLLQVSWAALRLLVQTVGVGVGSANGIIIIQCSQLITIIGGPVGYFLALNTYVAELTTHEERTGALGRMQGFATIGGSVGLLVGGLLSTAFGIASPFHVTLGLLILSTLYVGLCLPYIAPTVKASLDASTSSQNTPAGLARFFGPLKVLAPQKWVLPDGTVRTEYGALVLGMGVFMGILATGYLPTLLQMYATSVFSFGTSENSYLVSMNALLTGMFLTLVFPKIIAYGRSYFQHNNGQKRSSSQEDAESTSRSPSPELMPSESVMEGPDVAIEEPPPPKAGPEDVTYEFDLHFTRFSLLVDGTLTGMASLISDGWQMYLLGVVLPLGAGTASAAKGTVLQMCAPHERTDALSAITLVQMMARLSTTFVFGLIFAAFANIGKIYLVFVCNAAVAILGFGILFLARFAPKGAKRLDQIHDI